MDNASAAKLAALIRRRSQHHDDDVEAAAQELQEKLQLKLWLRALRTRTRVATARRSVARPTTVDVATLSFSSSDEAAKAIRIHGVCHLVRPALVDVSSLRADVLDRLDRVLARVKTLGLEVDGLKTREVVCRNHGRYDLILDDPPSIDAHWLPAVRSALGVECVRIKTGVVVALPGAAQQAVHVDGKPLFDRDDFVPLPPHCLTVFVPLLDLAPHLGPTEFFPGTHLADPSNYDAVSQGKVSGLTFSHALAGDAIIFDYRTRHRGRANTSPETHRPLLYFTYAKPWFRDATNYSDVSLFENGCS